MKVELIVPLVAQQGKADELEKACQLMLAPTHAEPANEFYRLYKSETPGHFFFHELWQSQDALDAHMKTAHFQNFEQVTKSLLAEPIAINKVHQIC
jgi:quinol monooxygenase YgiN